MHGCVRALTQYIHNAENQDKKTFFKEHTHILTNPVAQTRFVFGRGSIKESLPSPQCEEDQSRYNETLLPDSLLSTLKPTFLIRYPALAFHRKTHVSEHYDAALEPQLYEFYERDFNATDNSVETETMFPLVLDADDIMTKPAVVARFCDILCLDTTQLRYQWDTDKETRRPGIMAF
ncbi:hypothetical protein ETB97_006905 [Aspergillus alliaceus]|uniref:Uncharacterized protein n=1 Tax=Petromyces alliaceus TaxID=209559 RepID=A0A5N7CHP6_PETAA|nr:uncharacterized protein BDW43DRAFT_317088 [Aspergillus alliaceus]KAB8227176.1 hypothetical protein BDW43DRAFT_317088 [Aspergillus alliaceus]KAE8393710.1 hypothetical protein BDV23DRAFT_180475 [Aspergillus alliaceus]KAF5867059.1 hypothetical protein ETB97_006905 [Aspergillus burnettii]